MIKIRHRHYNTIFPPPPSTHASKVVYCPALSFLTYWLGSVHFQLQKRSVSGRAGLGRESLWPSAAVASESMHQSHSGYRSQVPPLLETGHHPCCAAAVSHPEDPKKTSNNLLPRQQLLRSLLYSGVSLPCCFSLTSN